MAIKYPLLSIIIPTYNRAHFLREALQSIKNQTIKDYEVIIVNDGSKDNTDEIVNQFELEIIYIKQQNSGLNTARNVALAKAKGKYIALLDDDDLWLDFKCELQIQILENQPEIAYVFSDFFIFNDEEKIPNGLQTWFKNPLDWNNLYEKQIKIDASKLIQKTKDKNLNYFVGNIYFELLNNPLILPSTAIFRKSFIKENLNFVEHDSLYGDWEFFARLSKHRPVAFIPFETALNRSHYDEVRITKMPKIDQVKHRLDLISRLWEKDEDFKIKNKNKIYEVKSELLLQLTKNYILIKNLTQAKINLKKINKKYIMDKNQYYLLLLLFYIPFSASLLNFILKLKNKIL